MDNFDNLIQGNILILGEKNKEEEVYKKLKSKLSKGYSIYFNKSDSIIISNIVVRASVDFNLINFSSFKFSKRVNVYRGNETLYNSTLLTKYLVDTLDYKKEKDNLFMTEYYRETFKIIYLYDTYNRLIQNIKQNISEYSQLKKYMFKAINIEKDNKTKQCFDILGKELKDCNKLLFLYNYSFIQDHSKTISTFLSINLGFDTDKPVTMIIDNIYGKWFDNFLVFNNLDTQDLITEIKYVLRKDSLSEYDLSKYFKNHNKIRVNKFIPIFNSSGKDARYISTYNSIQNKEDLENNLNFYINNYKFQTKSNLYSSIYLKEYVYKFDTSDDINKMKFGFRGKLEISKTKHNYKELSSHIFELEIDKSKYIVYFSDDFESFKGVEINCDKPTKIEGVLIII